MYLCLCPGAENVPTVTDVRTGAAASKDQYWQPDVASSEYTFRFALATKTRPPNTLGCPFAMKVPGKANAHFNFNRGVCAALKPARSADWKRAFMRSGLQPFQLEVPGENCSWVVGGQVAALVEGAFWLILPARNSATIRFSPVVSRAPCSFIVPDSSARRMLS